MLYLILFFVDKKIILFGDRNKNVFEFVIFFENDHPMLF